MSKGTACKCEGTREEKMKNWEVWQYKCNYSAFNGSRYTPSDYSCLHCTACRMVWRTKSDYATEIYYNQNKKS